MPLFLPSRASLRAALAATLAATLAALLQVPAAVLGSAAAALLGAFLLAAAADLWHSLRALRAAPLAVERSWPQALALGVRHTLALALVNPGTRAWQVRLFDGVAGGLAFDGLPQTLALPAGSRVQARYGVLPQRRGAVHFAPLQLRVRSIWGLFELQQVLGQPRELRVFPNFAALARYAWLAGDRRLTEIGIKSYVQRGPGTDFKQLREYRPDDPVRHIDWKATLRQSRPVVREFEDSRDQCVIFLLDCGRRMRADEGAASVEGSHFDQALNAMMLLSHVALKEGDEVGALTFGQGAARPRHFAPRKGAATLNALMARFYDVEPGTDYSDYQEMARRLMTVHRKRSLVVLLTNFRDEDAAELRPALQLLRTRHLVLLASLRERAHREILQGDSTRHEQAVIVAGSHLFEQARRDAFLRLVGSDPLAIDVEPGRLAVALVNHYHAVKKARLL
jgi:uncharacterized protein (DUF58 family)